MVVPGNSLILDGSYVQSFSKSLLDVADNLSRASSVVKESFSKIDCSNNSDEAVPLLKTLLEGVEMTEKQLGEVFLLKKKIPCISCTIILKMLSFASEHDKPFLEFHMHAYMFSFVYLFLWQFGSICHAGKYYCPPRSDSNKRHLQVFKKFGVQKFDPLNEKFDPNRHYAFFQIPDPSKPSGTVAAVVKVCIS